MNGIDERMNEFYRKSVDFTLTYPMIGEVEDDLLKVAREIIDDEISAPYEVLNAELSEDGNTIQIDVRTLDKVRHAHFEDAETVDFCASWDVPVDVVKWYIERVDKDSMGRKSTVVVGTVWAERRISAISEFGVNMTEFDDSGVKFKEIAGGKKSKFRAVQVNDREFGLELYKNISDEERICFGLWE